MRSNLHLGLALLAATLGLSCGGVGITDGGPVGTGITASVVGNVVAVEDPTTIGSSDALETPAATDESDGLDEIANVEGIEVDLVEFPDLGTTTDADGNFSLDGDFAGAVTLRFRTPELEVDQALDVPSGGVVVLSDIQLEQDGVTAEAGRQLGAAGGVLEIDCEARRLQMEDRRGDRIDVTLLEETEFIRDGAPATCTDLSRQDQVQVEGLIDDLRGRAMTALVVTIAPDSTKPPLERRVAFLGNIVAIDCATGGIAIHDGQHLVRIRITSETRIRDRRDDGLDCQDLSLGDRISGGGLLDLRQPGFVQGQLLVLGGTLGPGSPLPIRGVIAGTDCELGVLQVALDGAVVTVRILADTTIEPRDVACEDIQVGRVTVRGNGVVSADIPGALDARQLKLTKIKPDNRNEDRNDDRR